MITTNIQLHTFQLQLLKKLAKEPSARFNELLIEGLGSEHMNYHLKKLNALGFVEKKGNSYKLTDSGKDYSNLLDDEVKQIEKQPKTSVIIHVVRKNNTSGKIEHLLSKRLRQPYFGKVGRLGGKVRFGETLEQAAQRELYEETGLTPTNMTLESIYHKVRNREDGTCVQDVLFYMFLATDVVGTLIERTEHQENFWATNEDIKTKNLDTFDDLTLSERLTPNALTFSESIGIAKDY